MKKKMLERTVPPKLDIKIKKNEKAAVAFVHEVGGRKVLELALYEGKQLYARHFLDKDTKDYATFYNYLSKKLASLLLASLFYAGMRKFITSCSTPIVKAPTGVFISRPSMPTIACLA